ncbi:MAG TPA: M14 family zinc carboxypeptidase [Vicinamibacterales bacterium]|nr:M14 family zinc carboxypeptidase [Vicinamibacterales bacterium]
MRRLLAASVLVVAGIVAAAQPAVPTPASVIGWAPCSDYKLATYEQIDRYFRQLAAAVPERIRIVEMGKTAEGRVQILAIVSSESNLRQLDRYHAVARQLALASDLTDDAARSLAREGKAIVWIDFGLHSSEVAHAQTAPLLLFKVATDESAEMRAIRDNVILLLVANMNPDGTTMVANWYRENLGKPWENRTPELWHKYVGHDDNRDWYMFTQPESRNSARQLYDWFPQIVYNQHQAGPYPSRIFVPPFDDPMNPNIPPLVMRGVNLVGDAMTRRLDQEGKRGAVSRVGFDAWWNGGMRTAPYFHNMVGILTETSHASATPATYDPRTFPKFFPGTTVSTSEPSAFYPSPYRGGEWHLRNSCDYMVTTSMAALDIGAKRREEWLYDIYQMGRDAIRGHANETFVVSRDQWDWPTAVKMINTLRLGAVDIEQATSPFTAGGRRYPSGSFVIRGSQPFEPYVRDLLTPQVYPDMRMYPGGPPKRPYDITGWTLNLQMGVAVDRVAERVAVPTAPVDVVPVPAPTLDPHQNDSYLAINRLLKAGTPVRWANRVLTTAPRVGVYHAWGGNMDEGWTRWVLEQFEFPYARVFDRDVRAGNLRSRFDVVLLPDATYEQMLHGVPPGSLPDAYTGGMTDAGMRNLKAFVEAGGTLVGMDRAADLPLHLFDLPIRNVTAEAGEADFYIPGSILRIAVDPSNPIGHGMPAEAAAFFVNSPAFEVQPREGVEVVARYPASNLLLSGWLLGERVIAGRAAVVRARVGSGHVVLLGFRTEHRGQPHGTFKLLFNAILSGTE